MSKHCMIVGAGIAGVIAARRLLKQDWQVTLLEKSKGFGGRMATRRIENATFDHGAQYFTIHSMFFRALAEKMQDDGIVKEWARGFLNGDRILSLDGYLRLMAPEGMSSVVKYLAEPLLELADVKLNQEVSELKQQGTSWQVTCKSGLQIKTDAVILTPPLPQALSLLQTSGLELDEKQLARLKELKYDPCLTTLVTLDGPSGIAEPGAISNTDPMSPIAWLADNKIKGLSAVDCVTIQATSHFSRKYWKSDREEAAELLWQAAKHYVQSEKLSSQIHGWRYARPQSILPEDYLSVSQVPPLLLAGDAFGDEFHPIEGAALSGLEAAKFLDKTFT